MTITSLLICLELFAFGFIAYISRDLELRLLKGEPIPEGRIILYLRLLRPQHWIFPSTTLIFVAYPDFNPAMILILPAIFFQQSFLFGVNDYWDLEVDSLNEFKRKRNVVASGELSLKESKLVIGSVFSLGIIFSILLGPLTAMLGIVFFAMSYAYSAPPMRLKGKVYWDLVSHGFLVLSFPFLFTTTALQSYSLRNLLMYIILVLSSLYLQISQETRDYNDDARIETNSALAMGFRQAYLFMSLLLITSIIFCFFLVLSEIASSLFLLVAVLCVFALNDLLVTYRKKDYGACFPNTWSHFNKKAIVGLGPVLLWWLLHR